MHQDSLYKFNFQEAKLLSIEALAAVQTILITKINLKKILKFFELNGGAMEMQKRKIISLFFAAMCDRLLED